MKKKDIVVGGVYLAKVSGRVVEVRVDRIVEGMRYRVGKPIDVMVYHVTNLTTRKHLQFRSAMRFRAEAGKPPCICTDTSCTEHDGRILEYGLLGPSAVTTGI